MFNVHIIIVSVVHDDDGDADDPYRCANLRSTNKLMNATKSVHNIFAHLRRMYLEHTYLQMNI